MAATRNRSSRYIDISVSLCSIQTMIMALSPRPCLRLNIDSVPAPLRPLLWVLRNVNSLLPSAVFGDFRAEHLHHHTMKEAKHQACAAGSSPRGHIHAWQVVKIRNSLLPSLDFSHILAGPGPRTRRPPVTGAITPKRARQTHNPKEITVPVHSTR
jgi:hypothetical protein